MKNQINYLDKNTNTIIILVYDNENNKFICPKCKSKLEINTNKFYEIISINNKISMLL